MTPKGGKRRGLWTLWGASTLRGNFQRPQSNLFTEGLVNLAPRCPATDHFAGKRAFGIHAISQGGP